MIHLPALRLDFRLLLRRVGLTRSAIGLSLLVLFFSLLVSLSGLIRGFQTGLAAASTLLALGAGWRLGRTARQPGQILAGWLGLLLAGFLFNLIGISVPLAHLAELIAAWGRAAWQLLSWQTGTPLPDVSALRQSLGQVAQDIGQFWVTFQLWLGDLGGTSILILPRVNSFVWSLILWPTAAWSSWCLQRAISPLAAVMPAGVLVASSLAFSRANPAPLLPFLIALLLLMAWVTLAQQQSGWERRQLDWAEDIPLDTAIWSTLLTLGIVGVSFVFSLISPQKVLSTLQEWARPRSQAVQQAGEALGLPPAAAERPSSGLPQGELPRSHLLSGGPELSEKPVMLITLPSARLPEAVARNRPAPRYYWRAITYDLYTGRGWMTSPTQTREVPAGTWLSPQLDLPSELLTLSIQPYPAAGDWLYSPGQPLRVDQDLRIQLRQALEQPTEADGTRPALEAIRSGDWFGARLSAGPAGYQVQAQRLQLSQELLRQAGDAYPDAIRQRYLSLPPEVPERVRQLAQDLTASAATPYDRAAILENYLRGFEYSLQVPAPPPGREISDYFLFDLQRGYCDYYATSLAVMARLVGLPARLAIGYATGSYVPEEGQFWVTEAQAHSWVEIYFPGLGWVEFEPTAGLPAIERPQTLPAEAALPPSPPPTFPPVNRWQQLRPLLLRIGGLFLALIALLFGGLLFEHWLYSRLAWPTAARLFYRRIYRQGRRLGVVALPSLTPYEFAEQLITALNRQLARQRWLRLPPGWQKDIRLIIQQYVQAEYAEREPKGSAPSAALSAWQRLRWRLWLFGLLAFITEKYSADSASL